MPRLPHIEKPALVPNWRDVLRHAWSVRLQVISIILCSFEAVLPYLDGLVPLRPGAFALLILVVNLASTAARIIAQRFGPKLPEVDHHEGGV